MYRICSQQPSVTLKKGNTGRGQKISEILVFEPIWSGQKAKSVIILRMALVMLYRYTLVSSLIWPMCPDSKSKWLLETCHTVIVGLNCNAEGAFILAFQVTLDSRRRLQPSLSGWNEVYIIQVGYKVPPRSPPQEAKSWRQPCSSAIHCLQIHSLAVLDACLAMHHSAPVLCLQTKTLWIMLFDQNFFLM